LAFFACYREATLTKGPKRIDNKETNKVDNTPILEQNYLLFIGGPDGSKKYECIDTEDKNWLNFVKSQLR